jgi:hypothetical protein
MKTTKWGLLLACGLPLVIAAHPVQAAIISIDDQSQNLALFVNGPTTVTVPGSFPPGSGNPVDIITPTPSNGISAINYNPSAGSLSFTFANQVNWSADVFFYAYYTSPGDVTASNPQGYSDLFVIQGLVGTAPDHITFLSSDSLTGNILTDGPALLAGSTATRINVGPALETGDWQLAFNTGVDQYYIRSGEVPLPATLPLFATGLVGFGLLSWRRKKAAAG